MIKTIYNDVKCYIVCLKSMEGGKWIETKGLDNI